MIRLNRMRHLQRAMEATDRGEWHDLGEATTRLSWWLARHGLVEPKPIALDVATGMRVATWRYVRGTAKGRAALAEAKKEYARHGGPSRVERRRYAALKEELAEAFGINEAKRTARFKTLRRECPWPWEDWLAEQWGARSFRFMVLESCAESPFAQATFWAARLAPYAGREITERSS